MPRAWPPSLSRIGCRPRAAVSAVVVCTSVLEWSGECHGPRRTLALGRAAKPSDGPVARGKQGLVWRLDTADGSWAVKVPFHRTSEDEVRVATEFQEAAYAYGVLAPQVRRTTGGQVIADIAGRQVRV